MWQTGRWCTVFQKFCWRAFTKVSFGCRVQLEDRTDLERYWGVEVLVHDYVSRSTGVPPRTGGLINAITWRKIVQDRRVSQSSTGFSLFSSSRIQTVFLFWRLWKTCGKVFHMLLTLSRPQFYLSNIMGYFATILDTNADSAWEFQPNFSHLLSKLETFAFRDVLRVFLDPLFQLLTL